MATCSYCNSYMLFGGKRRDDLRFCNTECLQRGMLKHSGDQLPQHEVQSYTEKVHSSPCPRCHGPGPVDVYTSYRVWSAILFTSWSNRPAVSCRSCGVKRQLGGIAYSFVLGWWGIPLGLLATPIQILRNVFGLLFPPGSNKPSAKLENMLRLQLAAQRLKDTPYSGRLFLDGGW